MKTALKFKEKVGQICDQSWALALVFCIKLYKEGVLPDRTLLCSAMYY